MRVVYLVIFALALFDLAYVRSTLIEPGNAAATADNLHASAWLFRLGSAGQVVVPCCDAALAAIFYLLLRPVSRPLSLLAAFFRLAYAAIAAINLLNNFIALQLLSGEDCLRPFDTDQLNALAL